MDNTDDLRLLLASRYPLIVAEMRDEQRFLAILRGAAQPLGLPVWVWSIARGLARDQMEPIAGTNEPQKALDFIADNTQPGVFVLADVHRQIDDAAVVRRVKEIAQHARPGQTLVLTGPRIALPPDLEGLALPWSLKPPSAAEIEQMVMRTLGDLAARRFPVQMNQAQVASLVQALRGLSLAEAERLIQQAALRDGAVTADDVTFVSGRKAEMLDGGALELIQSDLGTLDAVGGLDALKEWLRTRGRALEPAARQFGLEPPRGVLVTGVPGCGKSLCAKTLARTWGYPLLLFDASRLYGSYVGESEGRLHGAFEAAEAMAPAVLWIDEIEKGFASGGTGDGGVSRRILGAFLRWMQDRPDGVFVVATCNDVTALPPELLRKGRFDEIFFVDLPSEEERATILRLHLARRSRDPSAFDVAAVGRATEGFSGAEIEAAVVGALYRAYAAGAQLTTEQLLDEVHATVPLAVTRAEEVAALRAWARDRAVPASRAAGPVSAAAR